MSKHQRILQAAIDMLDDGFDVEEVADVTGAPVEWVQAVYYTYYAQEDEY